MSSCFAEKDKYNRQIKYKKKITDVNSGFLKLSLVKESTFAIIYQITKKDNRQS